jgi:hypothetical protein
VLPSRPPTDDGRPSRLTTPPLSDCRRADGREAVEIRNLIPRPPGAGAAGSDSEKGRDPRVTAQRDGRLPLAWATKRPRSRQRPNRPRSFGCVRPASRSGRSPSRCSTTPRYRGRVERISPKRTSSPRLWSTFGAKRTPLAASVRRSRPLLSTRCPCRRPPPLATSCGQERMVRRGSAVRVRKRA